MNGYPPWTFSFVPMPRLGKYGKEFELGLNNGFEYREQIDNLGCGRCVLDYLADRYRHSSVEEWRRRIDEGEVSVNGERVHTHSALRNGQWLAWRRPPWEEPDVPLCYSVLHEDEELLAISKPSGLPTIPAGGFLENTLLTLVRKSRREAVPIHRLGRGTSGVVLFALTGQARSYLCAALRRKEITKIYRALAVGSPAVDSFHMDVPIGSVPHFKLCSVHAACSSGKRAKSRVTVLERRGDASLLEVEIETGRSHQVRIHLAAAGHPLVGDPLYGPGGVIQNPDALPGDTGYLLHAERLRLSHPVTGKVLEIVCKPPAELRCSNE